MSLKPGQNTATTMQTMILTTTIRGSMTTDITINVTPLLILCKKRNVTGLSVTLITACLREIAISDDAHGVQNYLDKSLNMDHLTNHSKLTTTLETKKHSSQARTKKRFGIISRKDRNGQSLYATPNRENARTLNS